MNNQSRANKEAWSYRAYEFWTNNVGLPNEVAYEKFFPISEKNEFPKCLLRYWTMGEIISSFATVGFIIEKLVEGPRFDSHKNIPGEFTLVASKLKIEK